jgi:hypothetical protein
MATQGIDIVYAQPAANGQSVLIKTQQDICDFSIFSVGNECQISTSGALGYIESIDLLANEMKVTPQYPYTNLGSDNNGSFLSVGDAITVTY